MKRCRVCKEERPLTAFYEDKKSPDLLRYECKDCNKRMQKEYRRDKGIPPKPTLASRLAESERVGGCLIWSGAKNRAGYGFLGRRLAHRAVAFAAGVALPPAGYDFHHKCGNRACVNLAHLQILPQAEHGLLSAAEAA